MCCARMCKHVQTYTHSRITCQVKHAGIYVYALISNASCAIFFRYITRMYFEAAPIHKFMHCHLMGLLSHSFAVFFYCIESMYVRVLHVYSIHAQNVFDQSGICMQIAFLKTSESCSDPCSRSQQQHELAKKKEGLLWPKNQGSVVTVTKIYYGTQRYYYRDLG
jgi:hypothetical protein